MVVLSCFVFFLKIRRPPRSTRTDTLFPTRRSSDLSSSDVCAHDGAVIVINARLMAVANGLICMGSPLRMAGSAIVPTPASLTSRRHPHTCTLVQCQSPHDAAILRLHRLRIVPMLSLIGLVSAQIGRAHV